MKICYFGIYERDFSRNKVYMRGLRDLGIEIVECQDRSRGLVKYWRLWRKHREVMSGGGYDAIVVGYPGHIVVPLAKVLAWPRHKPVIADLLGSLADAEKHSHRAGLIRVLKLRLVDSLAVCFADRVLLESEAQRRYFEAQYGSSSKYAVVYTGVDEGVFTNREAQLPSRQSKSNAVERGSGGFIVFFRGKLTPECGIQHILGAAELLKGDKGISFKIIGRGYLLKLVEETIREKCLDNVELVSRYLPDEEMREAIRGASLYLGQFEENHRLKRTIPHKAFEAFAAGIPYLSSEALAIQELVRDGETGFLVAKEDAHMIADKIRALSKDPESLVRVAQNARRQYDEKLTPSKLAKKVLDSIPNVA